MNDSFELTDEVRQSLRAGAYADRAYEKVFIDKITKHHMESAKVMKELITPWVENLFFRLLTSGSPDQCIEHIYDMVYRGGYFRISTHRRRDPIQRKKDKGWIIEIAEYAPRTMTNIILDILVNDLIPKHKDKGWKLIAGGIKCLNEIEEDSDHKVWDAIRLYTDDMEDDKWWED